MMFRSNFKSWLSPRKRIDCNASLFGIVVFSAMVAACGGGGASASSPASQPSQQGTTSITTDWGVINEPVYPDSSQICTTLTAHLTAVNNSADSLDSDPANSSPDTARIQSAIDNCPSGQAVKLVVSPVGGNALISGALTLKSGVTFWVDKGVILFASRNPSDFDNGVGACGTATTAKTASCKPFISVNGSTGGGIVGAGMIDGRGGSLLTSGPNAGLRSWWDVAYQSKAAVPLNQQNPRLLQIYNATNFTLHDIALLNGPTFHVALASTTGFVAWGIKILTPSLEYTQPGYACPAGTTPDKVTPATCFTPNTVVNTDGFDPGSSQNLLLAYSYISDGDDNVAIGAGGLPLSQNHLYAHNKFYYGHGLSIGSYTRGGAQNIKVYDLTVDGGNSPNGNGLRIKSDASRGGHIDAITYDTVCMRNERNPLAFDSFYSASTGTLYPSYTNIVVKNFHNLGSSVYAGGAVTFLGYDLNGQNNPIGITLDNVVFDAAPILPKAHNGSPSGSPYAAHFTFGPGPVSFASLLAPSATYDVTNAGTPGTGSGIDCSAAFVPLSSVLGASISPI
jgi:polygalacturonase